MTEQLQQELKSLNMSQEQYAKLTPAQFNQIKKMAEKAKQQREYEPDDEGGCSGCVL